MGPGGVWLDNLRFAYATQSVCSKRRIAYANAKSKAVGVLFDDSLATGTRGGRSDGSAANIGLIEARQKFLAAWLDACRAGQMSQADLAHEVVATLSAMEQLATIAGVH